MTTSSRFRLFEEISDQAFASSGIRPGGLELTRRGLVLSEMTTGSDVLDVGCGTGVTVGHLIHERGIRAVGLDSSTKLVARGKAREASLPITMGDAAALPFPDGTFHGVLVECVLSVVQDGTQVLKECHRVLKPFGKLIVTDLYARNPDAIAELRTLPIDSCLRGAFDKNRFVQDVSVVGFSTMCFEDHSDLLLDFAARMIWAYGSLDRFWNEATCGCVDSDHLHRAVSRARPGYFLFVGSKGGDEDSSSVRTLLHEFF
jgi:SAM-dependent methyltransferase